MKLSRFLLIIFLGVVAIFFRPFILEGKIPIPADTIVGMYHPWRDVVWDNLVAGVPFKNFLITDPVRQQYPWRKLATDAFKNKQLPLWNPYNFAGTPLLANFQSAAFYPLNVLFAFLPFSYAWGFLIFLQPLLAGIFLFLYLRELRLGRASSLLGALAFSFSGFFIAWLEWGTILHSALWLPLILLSIEKMVSRPANRRWMIVFIFSLVASFFAGHLQTFFYVFVFNLVYLIWKLSQLRTNRLKILLSFAISYLLFVIVSSIQWQPTWEFINLSARNIDQIDWRIPGWFIPWQNLVQFFAPDFFGNPATLNYWGVWNYGEFIGYVGVVPLLLAFLAVFRRPKGVVGFFAVFGLLALTFALPTPWAKLPYWLKIPLISTSQPTRLLLIVDFCLAVLAAFGLEKLLTEKAKFKSALFLVAALGFLWLAALLLPQIVPGLTTNLAISQRNLILPTIVLAGGLGILGLVRFQRFPRHLALGLLLALVCFDLIRFGWKFTPFTKGEWIFPSIETTSFLKEDKTIFRFMSADKRILPPNFSVVYDLQTVDGYDPLYLARYGELIAASERGRPDISFPFGFNRIVTPQNFNSRIVDLLNVKYVLSLTDLSSPKLGLVFKEGETRVYYNKEFFPRAFMVYNFRFAESRQKAIELLMDEKIDLRKKVILEENLPIDLLKLTNEKIANNVIIEAYQPNEVAIEVDTAQKGFLVLTDSYYPGWRAKIDGRQTKIYQADYNFRAIIVPSGKHIITFEYEN